jgi:hypothetical protein
MYTLGQDFSTIRNLRKGRREGFSTCDPFISSLALQAKKQIPENFNALIRSSSITLSDPLCPSRANQNPNPTAQSQNRTRQRHPTAGSLPTTKFPHRKARTTALHLIRFARARTTPAAMGKFHYRRRDRQRLLSFDWPCRQSGRAATDHAPPRTRLIDDLSDPRVLLLERTSTPPSPTQAKKWRRSSGINVVDSYQYGNGDDRTLQGS